MQNSVEVKNLTKKFTYKHKDKNSGWVKNLLSPKTQQVVAVNNISFNIKEGERVAFIGPNGAGKSTTIKMMTGILFPTSGSINVLGFDPTKNRKQLAYKIGTVFGQRSQLLPNLPFTDSFEFFGVMYDLSESQIKTRTSELIELFNLGSFTNQPVRKLSLGQRMRAEVAASLIHRPKIIFLDEPTIGLDVVAKKSLRDLLIKINTEENTTIFLTSHDAGDIETLCERTIVINKGEVISDSSTKDLSKSFGYEKLIDLFALNSFNNFPDLPENMKYIHKDSLKVTVSVNTNKLDIRSAINTLLGMFEIEDIDVYRVDLETTIRHIYEAGSIR